MSDSNLITDWRVTLMGLLAETFPEARVEEGVPPDKISRNSDLIAVYTPGIAEATGEVNFAQLRLSIRYYKARAKLNIKSVPPPEAPLEQAIWDLAKCLQPVQQSLWLRDGAPASLQGRYFRILAISPVREEYAVQGQLMMWTSNPATVALA